MERVTMTEATLLLDAATVTDATRAAERPRDQAQFAALLTEQWDRAYRLAYHLTGNAPDADDLVQQAAEEAFLAFDRFQPGTRFDRWLLRIMHNSFLDRVRKDRRRKIFSIDALPVPIPADRSTDPEMVLRGSLEGPVRTALMSLAPEFRSAIVLVDIEGLPYEDAAHILHLPIGTIRSRLHRGRLALREWLRPYVDAMKRGEV